MALNKRTPCVGICSTTYGDLICRGCKRFAHEIVQWNGYDESQKDQIWDRLNSLRDEVVGQYLSISDEQVFERFVEQAYLQDLAQAEQLYQLLRYLVRDGQPLAKAGLLSKQDQQDVLLVLQDIDAEIYARSKAHYERNFKVPV